MSFRIKRYSVYALPQRIGGEVAWDTFYPTIHYLRLRPERLLQVLGYADVTTLDVNQCFSSQGKVSVILGLETWLRRVPIVRTATVHHELLHAAQEAFASWITKTKSCDSSFVRGLMTLRAELPAHLLGSWPITLAGGVVYLTAIVLTVL
jgi:hypothetical protein